MRSYVIDRHGNRVKVRFDRITDRVEELSNEPYYGRKLPVIDPEMIAKAVIDRFRNGMTTTELDELTIGICREHSTESEDYEILAARLAITGIIHKVTPPGIRECVGLLRSYGCTQFSEDYVAIIDQYYERINRRIDHKRDFRFKYFGVSTLLRYLITAPNKASGSILRERPQHMYMRVAVTLFFDKDNVDESLEKAFALYDLLSTHKVSCASPILLNSGTTFQQMSSCFLNGIGDDLTSIFDTLKSTALISKRAGGIGLHLSSVRAENALIKSTGGKSCGIKNFIRLFHECQMTVNQGGLRPGAFAVYMEPWHADIMRFLVDLPRFRKERADTAPNLKYALWIPDAFMRALIDGTPWYLLSPDECPGLNAKWGPEFDALYESYVQKGLRGELRIFRTTSAREIALEAYRTIRETGTPYLCFKDNFNKLSNMNNVATIASSNLCVSADTYILTDQGQLPIGELSGQTVSVWNGEQWSSVQVAQTGQGQSLVRVSLSNGVEIECTPYHKFYDAKGVEIRAADLQPGTKLEKTKSFPVIKAGEPFAYAYTHGLFCAEGCYDKVDIEPHRCPAKTGDDLCGRHLERLTIYDPTEDGQCRAKVQARPILQLYHEKQALLPHIEGAYNIRPDGKQKRTRVHLPDDLPPKFEVPLQADLDSKLRWLEGFADGDGNVVRNGDNVGFHCSSVEKDFLLKIRLMLQTLGCDPKVSPMREAGMRTIRGREYECAPTYRLLVSSVDLGKLVELGFSPKRLNLSGAGTPNRDARQFTKVVSVEPIEGLYDTFCFNEPLAHRGIFNGVKTGQCAEVSLPSWSDYDAPLFGHEKGEVGVCNLGSIVVAEFVGECADSDGSCIDYAGISAAAGILAEALDNVIDRNYYPVEAAERSNKRHRPIGIGMLGLADVFAMLKIVYGSRPAQQIDAAIMSAIYYGAVKKSAELAKIKGSYPSFDYNGGCPASRGQLQPDLWTANGFLETGWEERLAEVTGITADDWDYLRAQVKEGLRNAYLTACMPTASTAIMVARNESFEPFTSNLYARNTLSGEFLMVNRYLLKELMELGLWSHELRMQLINDRGSVQNLPIPESLKLRYRTAQEMDQRLSVRHSAARGPFVCQSQSLNFFYRKPQFRDILTIMRDGWRAGLKTGAYYHHSDDGNTSFKSAVVGSAKSVTNIEEAMEATAQALQRVAITTKEEDRDPAPTTPTKLVKLESGVQQDAFPRPSMPALNVDEAIAFACPRGKGGPGCEACSG